ncbi:hypothetical protein HPP92_027171 [Vanilla planifolia]|uniref:Uncharacterized protein n=1 Tax=Vanilla planifolia TaxID=51239 RepID=A0A835U4Y5_VANPL|nr:hypothetical protein HPP92_027171 [Vanilla planifolia]
MAEQEHRLPALMRILGYLTLWRAEQEKVEATRRTEEQRIARVKEKKKKLMEEKRRNSWRRKEEGKLQGKSY